jgi:hypothetical protein
MSFESVWGFNPDKKANTGNSPAEHPPSSDCAYTPDEERAAQMPLGSWAQINELERLSQL